MRAVSQSGSPAAAISGARVLVTGAAGFIGSELVRALIRSGAVTHAAVRPMSDPRRLSGVHHRASLHEVDVRDRLAVARLMARIRPDYVVNAVQRRNEDTTAARQELIETLVLGTTHLLEAGAEVGCRRFVQLGSSLEYGRADQPLAEDMSPMPSSFFGGAKAATSMLCRAAGRSGPMPTVVLRPFMVYGPRDLPNRLVPSAIRAALSGTELALTRPGYRRDWIFVSDVAEGCVRALGGAADNEVVNLGTGELHANEEIVDFVQRIVGVRISTRVGAMPARPWDTGMSMAATEKARTLLGWEPQTTLAEGIMRTISYERGATGAGSGRATQSAGALT